jgi:hypothetical protein
MPYTQELARFDLALRIKLGCYLGEAGALIPVHDFADPLEDGRQRVSDIRGCVADKHHGLGGVVTSLFSMILGSWLFVDELVWPHCFAPFGDFRHRYNI